MNTNEWITDRLPNDEDGIHGFCVVHNAQGRLVYIGEIKQGEAWKALPPCEPYVKPKRYNVRQCNLGGYDVHCDNGLRVAMNIPTREAAEEIAAIYEEVMP